MKCFRQLLRQPLKFITGVTVVSFAVSILCICLGQSVVADKTQRQMEHHFTTIALPTTKYNWYETYGVDWEGNRFPYTTYSKTMPEEIADWINNVVATRPDLVEVLATPGLASAYIENLAPENITDHMYHDPLIGNQETGMNHNMAGVTPYDCTMLEVVLEKINEPEVYSQKETLEDGTEVYVPVFVTVELVGNVKSVVALQEGYEDPTNRTIRISIEMPNQESIDALNLTIGERYLVYGTDYLDGDWAFCGHLSTGLSGRSDINGSVEIKELDENCLFYYTDKEKENFLEVNPYAVSAPVAYYLYKPDDGSKTYRIDLWENTMRWKDSVLLTLRDQTVWPRDRYITDEQGNQIQLTQEEFRAMYSIPMIAHLEGSVEDFLASEEGRRWAAQLELMKVNYQSFPIIGVDKLGYIAEFGRETARIVAGRDFIPEELTSGAKVCIIAETLAAANGLTVGDTISPRFYNYDYNDPYQGFLAKGKGLVNPAAYRFTAHTEWAGEAEEYVIVGLYRQDNAWCNVAYNPYTFTPNTVFAPKSAITSDMDFGSQAFFKTLILKNGVIEEFRAVVDEAGYHDLFVFYDQGYTTISNSLQNYRQVAQRAMIIGLIVYSVILVLFLLFFPGSQGKALSTMNALGAQRKHKVTHVFMSSADILIPGTTLGVILGVLLWQKVINMIAESVDTTVVLEMDVVSLLLIALTQMVLAFALTGLMSIPMTRNKGLTKRK